MVSVNKTKDATICDTNTQTFGIKALIMSCESIGVHEVTLKHTNNEINIATQNKKIFLEVFDINIFLKTP
jgi:hypothetical protein